jgi:hypothetical protein
MIIFMMLTRQRVEANELERKHLRGKETKVILSDSNLSLRGSNIMIEGMTNHGDVEFHQEYPFDSLISYDFILKDSKKIELWVQPEEENEVLEEEQIIGIYGNMGDEGESVNCIGFIVWKPPKL